MSPVRAKDALGAFLRSRREALRPEDIGLRRGPHRRVGGLRREEVAELCGISADYIGRLEHRPKRRMCWSVAWTSARRDGL